MAGNLKHILFLNRVIPWKPLGPKLKKFLHAAQIAIKMSQRQSGTKNDMLKIDWIYVEWTRTLSKLNFPNFQSISSMSLDTNV